MATNCSGLMQALETCAVDGADSTQCPHRLKQFSTDVQNLPLINIDIRSWRAMCEQICNSGIGNDIQSRAIIAGNCQDRLSFSVHDADFIQLAGQIAILCFGLLALTRGYYSGRLTRRLLAGFIKTTGKVVAHVDWHSRKGTEFAPVIQFSDREGKTHRFTSPTACRRRGQPCERIGSHINVRYPIHDPEAATDRMPLYFWMEPLFMTLFGAVFTLAAGLSLFNPGSRDGHYRYLQIHAPAIAQALEPVGEGIQRLVLTARAQWPHMAIHGFRVVESGADSVLLDVDYDLPWTKHGEYYMDAITLTNGSSGGQWATRPARLKTGSHSARIWIGMNSAAADYCSNQIRLSIYQSQNLSEHVIDLAYEKCWRRQH